MQELNSDQFEYVVLDPDESGITYCKTLEEAMVKSTELLQSYSERHKAGKEDGLLQARSKVGIAQVVVARVLLGEFDKELEGYYLGL